MAEELKTGPYEVLIRFNCERGEDFGKVRGVHIQQRRYVVDGGKIAGRVEPRKEDMAAPITMGDLDALFKQVAPGSEHAMVLEESHRTRREKERAESDLGQARVQLNLARHELANMETQARAAEKQVSALQATVVDLKAEISLKDVAAADRAAPAD